MVWVCALLLALEMIVYAPVWQHEFTDYDDPAYVSGNPDVAAGLTWRGVGWALTTGHASNWHPLTWLSHMLDVELFGMKPGPHHLSSVLVHMVNTLLLFGVLQRMTGQVGRSAVVAGLFGVHPLHVESVAWVAERKDVLSTLFWLLTLWGYVEYVRRPGWRRYVVVMGLFGLGLMAKPMLVTLPFVLLLLDVWPLGRLAVAAGARSGETWIDRRAAWGLVVEKLPLFGLTVVSSVVTFAVQQHGGAVSRVELFPFGQRVANAMVAYVAYLGKMLWPTGLAVFYPYPHGLPLWQVVGSALVLLAVTAVAIGLVRRAPYVAVGWCWYVGTLVPVIGLVQVGSQSMADRYTYVPLIGVFIVLAWGVPALVGSWPQRRVVLGLAAGAGLVASVVIASHQVQYWKNREALWTRAVEVTIDNWNAHDHLGLVRAAQGRVDEAIAHYRAALRIRPDYEGAHVNLGNLQAARGRMDDAIAHYGEALRIKPDLEIAHNNLGVVLARLGRADDAIAHYTEALRVRPAFVDAHRNKGIALVGQGRLDEASREFLEVLRIAPGDADAHYRVGLVFAAQGRVEPAARHLEAALRIDPNLQQARRALADLTSRGGGTAPGPR